MERVVQSILGMASLGVAVSCPYPLLLEKEEVDCCYDFHSCSKNSSSFLCVVVISCRLVTAGGGADRLEESMG